MTGMKVSVGQLSLQKDYLREPINKACAISGRKDVVNMTAQSDRSKSCWISRHIKYLPCQVLILLECIR